MCKAIKNGKRFYVGSGTSGRLGVLDASEIPPTFSTNHLFTGIIAGGDRALKSSIEGAEDIGVNAIKDLKKNKLKSGDVVIGINASGAAKYVVSAIEFAINTMPRLPTSFAMKNHSIKQIKMY